MKSYIKFTIICVIIALVCFVYNWNKYKSYKVITGKVTSIEVTKHRKTKKYRSTPIITFKIKKKQTSNYIPTVHFGKWKMNQKVELIYDPMDPNDVTRNEFYLKHPITSILLSLAFIIYFFASIGEKRRAKGVAKRAKWKAIHDEESEDRQ